MLMSWHLEHNSKAAQELASLDSLQIVHSICCEWLFTHHQKQNPWVAIGPREKPDPLVLSRFFWACSTENIQFPCQTYLTHCCMPIRLWVRRGPKVQPSVNVTIPLVSECCSAWMLLWFLGWGEFDCSPEKRTIYAVTRWLARQVGQRETCSKAWKNEIFSDRTGSRADLQESFNLRGAFWVDGKFRNFLDPTQTCSKLGAWDLCPYWGIHEENTADLWGEWDPGIQGRWGEFSLASWTCSCKPCFLDLSFGVAPVCCHSEKTHMFFLVLPHDGPKRPITSWPSNRIAWFWVSFQCHRTLCKSTFSLKLSNWTKNQPIALSCYDSVCPSAKGAVSGNLVG